MEDAKKVFNQLKVDSQSVAFAEELLNKKTVSKTKKIKISKGQTIF